MVERLDREQEQELRRVMLRINEEGWGIAIGAVLGLGLFIAKTLIERSGAELTLTNAAPPASGAIARIVWPRHAFERGAAISPQGDTKLSLKG
jgi:signal transduction histidine kinase